MTRVLVALDGTDDSVRAATTASGLFGADAEYLVVNVAKTALEFPETTTFGGVIPLDPESWTMLAETIDTAAANTAEAGAEAAGLESAEVVVEHGDPVQAICAAAAEHAVDVIVVGSHDKGRLARIVSPSVADGVVHHTTVPVLVVSGTPAAG